MLSVSGLCDTEPLTAGMSGGLVSTHPCVWVRLQLPSFFVIGGWLLYNVMLVSAVPSRARDAWSILPGERGWGVVFEPLPGMDESENLSVMSESLWPHGLYSPWNPPGQNTGVGSLSFLQGSSNPGIKPRSPTLQVDSLPAEPQGKPKNTDWVAYPFSRQPSWPRNWTGVSCIAGGFFTKWAIREALAWMACNCIFAGVQLGKGLLPTFVVPWVLSLSPKLPYKLFSHLIVNLYHSIIIPYIY